MFYSASAVILAGGRGRRIGRDKKELVLNGEKIIESVIARFSGRFDEIFVSSNTPFEREGVTTVRDTLGEGPLAGIYGAMTLCRSAYLYVTACDMPFVSLPHFKKLYDIITESGCDICAGRRADGFIEPFNAVYDARLRDSIRALLEGGLYKMSGLITKSNVRTIDISDDKEYYNINYEDDLRKARDIDSVSRNIMRGL